MFRERGRVPPFHDLHSGSPWRKINCANRGSIRSIRLVLARQRIHPVINRLQLVENQKVSINGGLADLNSPSRGRPTANFVADQVFLLLVCRVNPLEAGHLYISLRAEGIKEEVPELDNFERQRALCKEIFFAGTIFSSIIRRQEVSAINSPSVFPARQN